MTQIEFLWGTKFDVLILLWTTMQLLCHKLPCIFTLSNAGLDLWWSRISQWYCFLFSQLEQAEQASYGDESLLTEMRDEFSKRVGEMNTKLNKVVKVFFWNYSKSRHHQSVQKLLRGELIREGGISNHKVYVIASQFSYPIFCTFNI